VTFYWAPKDTELDDWPAGWIPLGYTVEGCSEAFEVPAASELGDDEYGLRRLGLEGRSISFTFRLTTLRAWRWHRMFTGRRHPGERAARQRYVRRLRARRRRSRR
jgi:hypothetical protein